MNVPSTIVRTRRALIAGALVSALLWGAGAGAATIALTRLFAPRASLLALLAAGVASFAVLWRWRWARSRPSVALWLEEHEPALQYALVTRLEPRFAGLAGELDGRITAARPETRVYAALRRVLLPAAAAAITGLLALAAASSETVARRADVVVSGRGSIPGLAGALAEVTADIEPPAYARARRRSVRDPETIRALVGSRITVRGGAAALGVTASLGDVPLAVGGRRWRTDFVIPAAPRALRLADSIGGSERVIVVEPVEDEAPRATLTLPVRDTVLRAAPASIAVAAEVADDIGLSDAAIEFMVSSGQEETFTARNGRVAGRALDGERGTRLSGTLTNAVLRLGPGDVLSIRAVARDRNNVSGPGIGTSETRTIRIARSDEDDSLSVEAIAPVFGDSALLSQRMILQHTEALERAMPSLSRDSVVQRATAIAFDQERLRNRVHSLVFPGHEHADESPMAGEPPDHAEPADPVNADLKEAYEAMWEAGRELRIASPGTAIPPMRVAVAALDRARMANRLYLRGGTARVTLDLERVRLIGTERGTSSARRARPPADTTLRALANRLARLAADSTGSVIARINALSELRVELLAVSPRAAGAVAAATAALRAGRSPRSQLQDAAAGLAGEVTVRDEVLPWSGW